MSTIAKGDVVHIKNPFPDEDSVTQYIVVDAGPDHAGRRDCQLFRHADGKLCDWLIKPIIEVVEDDLEVVSKGGNAT